MQVGSQDAPFHAAMQIKRPLVYCRMTVMSTKKNTSTCTFHWQNSLDGSCSGLLLGVTHDETHIDTHWPCAVNGDERLGCHAKAGGAAVGLIG